jgi:hypothetical protein
MADERIGNLDAGRTIYTVIMSGASQNSDKTGLRPEGAGLMVRNIMRELFQPGWYWALREIIANGTPRIETDELEQEQEPTVEMESMLGMAIRHVIDQHMGRTGVELADGEIANVLADFKGTVFHPAFIPFVRGYCDGVMAKAEAVTSPLEK